MFLKDIKGSNPGINNFRVRASAPPEMGWGVWAAALLTGSQAAPRLRAVRVEPKNGLNIKELFYDILGLSRSDTALVGGGESSAV